MRNLMDEFEVSGDEIDNLKSSIEDVLVGDVKARIVMSEQRRKLNMLEEFSTPIRRTSRFSGAKLLDPLAKVENVDDNTFDREYLEKYEHLMGQYDEFSEEAKNIKEEYKLLSQYFDLSWHKDMKNEKFVRMMMEVETVVKIIESLYEDGVLNREKALHIKVGYKYLAKHIDEALESLTNEQIDDKLKATLKKANHFRGIIETLDGHLDERELKRIETSITNNQLAEKLELDDSMKEALIGEWHPKGDTTEFSVEDLGKIMKISMLKNLSNKSNNPNTNTHESHGGDLDYNEDKFIQLLRNHDLEDFFTENYTKDYPTFIDDLRNMLSCAFQISNGKKPLNVDIIDLDDDDDERGVDLGEDLEKIHLNIKKDGKGLSWSPIFTHDDVVNKEEIDRDNIISIMRKLEYPELEEWTSKTQNVGMETDTTQDLVQYSREFRFRPRITDNFIPTWSVDVEHKSLKSAINNLEKAHFIYTEKLKEVDKEMEDDPSLESKYMEFTVKLRDIERRKKRLMGRIDKIATHEIKRNKAAIFEMPERYSREALSEYYKDIKEGKNTPIEDTSNVIIMMKEMLDHPDLSSDTVSVIWRILTEELKPKGDT